MQTTHRLTPRSSTPTEHQVGEDGSELGRECAAAGEDARADQVRRDEVRRELNAAERAADDVRQRLDGGGFGQSGHALEQHVAAREKRHEQALQEMVLSDDEPPELEQDLLHDT